MKFHTAAPIRALFLPLLRATARDLTIDHHWTKDRFRLNTYRHKGYWFHRRNRERGTMRALSLLIEPGDTVIEAGGHIGYITLWFSRLVGLRGRVIVFEPGSNNLPYLRQNVRVRPNVCLIEEGCGAKAEIREFFEDDLTGQNNSFIRNFDALSNNARNAGGHPLKVESHKVKICRLDHFLAERALTASLVKIDTEGYEVSVLEGCEGLFNQMKPPKFMVETHAANRATVLSLFRTRGYQVFDENGAALPPDGPASDNLFMLHPEHHFRSIAAWTGPTSIRG
jgi:FkbM family methyltransferase